MGLEWQGVEEYSRRGKVGGKRERKEWKEEK